MKHSKHIGICAMLLAMGMLTACGDTSSSTADSSKAETTTSAAADTTTKAPDTTAAKSETTTTAEITVPTTAATELIKTEPVVDTQKGYTDDDLIYYARRYYGSRKNWVPEFIEVDSTEGDTVTLHLYDVVDYHTTTCEWYYIDRKTGKGTDFSGNEVYLTEQEAKLLNPEVPQRADMPTDKCCAVQYIGTFPQGSGRANGYNAALIETFLLSGLNEEYPFLGKLMRDETFAETQSAQELYLIIPRDPEARVTVTECDPVAGSRWGHIYSSYNGTPFLLYCNHSEVASDVEIQITDNSGEHEAFSVYLSGMDGSPKVSNDCAVVLTPTLHSQYDE